MDKIKYPVLSPFADRALVNSNQYQELYKKSVDDPEQFWKEQAIKFISWFSPWKTVLEGQFKKGETTWFKNGKLNACYNALDRHLTLRRHQTALVWEGDNEAEQRTLTYEKLYSDVCKFANVLKKLNVKKGDRVCIYLPMIPEAAIAMLACARIGAIHSVVFAGFSAEALKARILDLDARVIVTADSGMRGGKEIPTKENVDNALTSCPHVQHVVVVKRTGKPIPWNSHDSWYHEKMTEVSDLCPPEEMDANDPLFILYTSGSTGKPKGILHTTGGYLVYTAITFKYIFDYHENDIYWCTADVGWITGHSYLIYGPLINGATVVMYEGTPHFPTFSRFWEVIDRHQVTIFYTAPTAIRALRREGDQWVKKTNRTSLRLLGTVGEPINPDVWEWYFQIVGEKRCPIVDTWWQTETGGILISPLPGATALKPGSATKPFFGIEPDIIDDQGRKLRGKKTGRLVIKKPWPGMMKTIYGDHARFIQTYFSEGVGYLTGDGARRNADGYYWITGRNDDVIKVSGHRLGTEELESALISHPDVSEAAVVGIPHEIKGESVYAFVTPKEQITPTAELTKQVIQQVRKQIGAIATPEKIQWTTDLPKTRSGKIMRRILRKIATDQVDDIGDISTLANPEIVKKIVEDRKKLSEMLTEESGKN